MHVISFRCGWSSRISRKPSRYSVSTRARMVMGAGCPSGASRTALAVVAALRFPAEASASCATPTSGCVRNSSSPFRADRTTYDRSPARTTYRSGRTAEMAPWISLMRLWWKSSQSPKASIYGSIPGNGERMPKGPPVEERDLQITVYCIARQGNAKTDRLTLARSAHQVVRGSGCCPRCGNRLIFRLPA